MPEDNHPRGRNIGHGSVFRRVSLLERQQHRGIRAPTPGDQFLDLLDSVAFDFERPGLNCRTGLLKGANLEIAFQLLCQLEGVSSAPPAARAIVGELHEKGDALLQSGPPALDPKSTKSRGQRMSREPGQRRTGSATTRGTFFLNRDVQNQRSPSISKSRQCCPRNI